jgi:hypothetical protein
MYDAAKILAGILVFLAILLSPVWYNAMTGKAAYVPALDKGTDAKQCVEETGFMRANHMDLLNDWKETVVREGARTYTAKDGRTFTMSLTGTCMKCHTKKEQFCDRCHDYTGVKPYCWECHNYQKAAGK